VIVYGNIYKYNQNGFGKAVSNQTSTRQYIWIWTCVEFQTQICIYTIKCTHEHVHMKHSKKFYIFIHTYYHKYIWICAYEKFQIFLHIHMYYDMHIWMFSYVEFKICVHVHIYYHRYIWICIYVDFHRGHAWHLRNFKCHDHLNDQHVWIWKRTYDILHMCIFI